MDTLQLNCVYFLIFTKMTSVTIPVIDLSKTYFGKPQAHKIAELITTGVLETPDTTPVYVSNKDDDGFITLCHGEDVPNGDEAGFLKGCHFIDSNETNGTNPEWINAGDEEACDFIRLPDSTATSDVGSPMRNVLRVASNVVSTETVTVGDDVYEIEIVNTDSTDDTANDNFNNITNPLVVGDAVANYPECDLSVGMLVRIQNEILRVTANDGTDVTFQRGVSGTTTATHADGQNIYVGDGIDPGSTIAVGLVTTLTPAVFTPALANDINNSGTMAVFATSLQTGAEMLLESSDGVGADVVSSSDALACTETLGGTNNGWAAATMFDGKDAGARGFSMFTHTVLAVEVALSRVRLSMPFIPTGFIVQAYNSSGLFKGTLSDDVTISGNQVLYTFAGSTHLVAGDTVTVMAWN